MCPQEVTLACMDNGTFYTVGCYQPKETTKHTASTIPLNSVFKQCKQISLYLNCAKVSGLNRILLYSSLYIKVMNTAANCFHSTSSATCPTPNGILASNWLTA